MSEPLPGQAMIDQWEAEGSRLLGGALDGTIAQQVRSALTDLKAARLWLDQPQFAESPALQAMVSGIVERAAETLRRARITVEHGS